MNKTFGQQNLSFSQLNTSVGVGVMIISAAGKPFYGLIIKFDLNTILFDPFVISLYVVTKI